MGKNYLKVLTATILFLIPGFLLSQAPNLGSVSSFALFTSSGNITNGTGGGTSVSGNVGTNSGTVTMANGSISNGTVYIANATTSQAATDLNAAFNSLTSTACGTTIANALGSLTLTPNVYCTVGAASITGTLTLDGQGNPNSVFIIKTGIGLTLNNGAKVNVINSASQCNVYWQVNGALTLVNNSILRGTALVNGAIDQQQGSTVFGRALTKTGNITLKNSTAAVAFPPTASTISAAGTTTFCAGGSVVLSGNTGGTWSPGGSTSTSITATTGGTYYVTNTTNCGSVTSNSIIVTVNPLPIVAVNSGTICNGNSIVLNATGASTYSWAPGATLSGTTGASVTANPSVTTTYSVTGTSTLGCVKTSTSLVTVNSKPVVSVNSATICEGSSAVLTASGANTYTWSPATFLNTTNGATVSTNANVNTTYTVTGSSVAGCTNTATASVMVNASPVISVNSATICEGGAVELIANGAVTYSWNPSSSLSATTGATVTANPSLTSSYTVTGTDAAGCMSSATANVMVVSNPTVSVSSATICEGSSAILTASGAATFSWSPAIGLSSTTGSTVTANPSSTTVYTVTGSGGNCFDSESSTVTVDPLPVATISADGPLSFCQGGQVVLNASAGSSYLWSNNETTQSVTVTTSGDYSVTVTGANGCSATSSVTSVIENSLPTISVNSATICTGGSVTLNASGADTYSWSPGTGLSATTGPSVVADPASSTTYTITGTNSESCVNSTTASVTVVSNPVVSVNSSTICEGSSAVLTATGANSYIWSTGATTGSISVSPNANTSYTVTGSINGCSASDVADVTVLTAPTVGANANPASICSGASSTLTATGASTYSWNTGATGSSISVSPANTTNYIVTGTAGNGCTNLASVTVTVTSCSGETAISSVPCGLVLASMKTEATAMNVTGATQYRFKFYDNTSGTLVATKTQASRTFTFNTISGLYYGNTYKWTVAVDKGIGFGPESSNACTVTFDSPQTTLPCGSSFTNLSSYSTSGFVYSGSGYRFSFYNNSTNALVAVKTQTSNYIYFNTVPGLVYGNTYKWTVEALYNNGSSMVYGAPSSSVCTITFNPPQPTLPCGSVFNNLNSYTTSQFVSGATAYRFSFYNSTTNALVAVKTQTSNYIYFNQVPGLAYGNTYKWTVEAQYNNGSGLVYGPPSSSLCTVSFSSPQATLPCGPTYTASNAYSTSSFVSGTNAYRFTFYDATTNALVAVKTNTNNYIYFNQVPGLVYNKTYKWTVEVQYNNGSGYAFGPPSSNSCTMTWGIPYQVSMESGASDISTARMFTQSDQTNQPFIVNAYPNPTNGLFTIDLSEDRQVEISNILGEKISDQLLMQGKNQLSLEGQPDGIYFVKIRSDNRQEVIKIIKEN